jgi:hypothetical protein
LARRIAVQAQYDDLGVGWLDGPRGHRHALGDGNFLDATDRIGDDAPADGAAVPAEGLAKEFLSAGGIKRIEARPRFG